MIYLRLFLEFLKIGAFTFGGGFSMISIIRETMLANGWFTEGELLNFIAVAESTPGPIAVNMATFVGSAQGGIAGSLAATLGVVLPSFVIILLIASLMSNFLKHKGIGAFLSGVRPCIVAMMLSTAAILGMSELFSFSTLGGGFSPDFAGIIILAVLIFIHIIMVKSSGKRPSPVIMILLSAILGIFLYK